MLLQDDADAVLDEARDTTRRVARTFALACRLLPRDLRDDVYLLYLVFRELDDLVDEQRPAASHRVAAVEAWCDGRPVTPSFRTREVAILTQLDRRHSLPRAALREFCAGMRSDLAKETYRDEAAVDEYCYRVAGTVGVVMTALLGTHDLERAEAAAAALGMAMQRTNILRDIDEDLDNGRVYLAQDTLERCGGSLAPGCREELLRDQIDRADALYREGLEGVMLLRHGRRAVSAAAHMYREILRQIEREGYGAIPGRAVVPQRRKLFIAAQRAALSR